MCLRGDRKNGIFDVGEILRIKLHILLLLNRTAINLAFPRLVNRIVHLFFICLNLSRQIQIYGCYVTVCAARVLHFYPRRYKANAIILPLFVSLRHRISYTEKPLFRISTTIYFCDRSNRLCMLSMTYPALN